MKRCVLVFALAACTQPPPKPTWHRDVGPLVQAKCSGCHRAGGIAPFALTTFSEFMKQSEAARLAVTQRVMPPWPASKDCTEYDPDGSLTDEQISLIDGWLSDGAMEGDPKDFQALEVPQNALSRIDRTVAMTHAFTPTHGPDEYRCFVLDWPETEDQYITGYALEPGLASMVHHSDIFFINPQHADAFRARDPNGDGYTCYSIPVLEGGWIGTFVPGNRGVDFPEGTGLKMVPGSKVFLQTHYNTQYTGAQPDLSQLHLRLEKRVRKPAVVEAMSDLKWITERTMVIPAYAKDTGHRFEEDPTLYISAFNKDLLDGVPVKIYAGTLHMHQMGSSAKLEIVRKDGTRECVNDVPKWDFHWQLPYTMRAPKVINPGDKLAVECHWDNSQENQPIENGVRRTPRELNWGANTNDEMCVGGVYLTE